MSPEEVKRQLHQQARESQAETIAMYERWAAEEHAAGNEVHAALYAKDADEERARPLPNAA
jgi:predicted nuclease of restriction endonuclease-like RecB superfamily